MKEYHIYFVQLLLKRKRAASVLGWVVKEMENRYKLMTKVGVRNIDGYNEKHKISMPYIVVIVDEMSDLMLVAGKGHRKLHSKTITNGKSCWNTYHNGNSKTKCRCHHWNYKS